MPSRLTAVDITRLRQAGARPAGPPPAGPRPGAPAATSCVEVQQLVNSFGIITLGGQVMHVLTQDGVLWRTLPCPSRPVCGTHCKTYG